MNHKSLKNHILMLMLFSFFLSLILGMKGVSSVFASEISQTYKITVTANVGAPLLNLYGYTSAHALVTLTSIHNYQAQTIANDQGYFEFRRAYLPFSYSDLCLSALDTNNNTTHPVCIPKPYIANSEDLKADVHIGPVLLSPTLSLTKGKYFIKEHVYASGQTIPNSDVQIAFYKKPKGLLASWQRYISSIISIVPNFLHLTTQNSPLSVILNLSAWTDGFQNLQNKNLAFASQGEQNYRLQPSTLSYSLPTYNIKSNQNGNFSFNLPANDYSSYRVFAGAIFADSPTPKSNTLKFEIINPLEFYFQILKVYLVHFLNFIKSLLTLENLLILQIALLIAFFFIKTWRKKEKALIPAPEQALTTVNN